MGNGNGKNKGFAAVLRNTGNTTRSAKVIAAVNRSGDKFGDRDQSAPLEEPNGVPDVATIRFALIRVGHMCAAAQSTRHNTFANFKIGTEWRRKVTLTGPASCHLSGSLSHSSSMIERTARRDPIYRLASQSMLDMARNVDSIPSIG